MMLLKAKIYMCLSLWNPDVTMHSASSALLSHWYNQTVAVVAQSYEEEVELEHAFLSWREFRRLFSLPNSEYRHITTCIKAPSEET